MSTLIQPKKRYVRDSKIILEELKEKRKHTQEEIKRLLKSNLSLNSQ